MGMRISKVNSKQRLYCSGENYHIILGPKGKCRETIDQVILMLIAIGALINNYQIVLFVHGVSF